MKTVVLMCSCLGLLFVVSTANATSIVYSNFGAGDSVKNSVHDVLNQNAYLEHAARFVVPPGTDFFFTGVDLAIQDALIANEGIESQLSVRLWTDSAGAPGSLLESTVVDVIQPPPGYLVQRVESTTNTTLLQNEHYWISLAAINPGRIGWFVNNTETGGYALKDPARSEPWLVIDTASAGAFRVVGNPVPEPTSLALLAFGAAGIVAWRRTR